ncbi:MAG: YceI family protein [Flavobacteriales bacterium]|jgi:polyisoprenoid-binding protein YceI|nr:YceI family protein [Flavobacteriales bacterium]
MKKSISIISSIMAFMVVVAFTPVSESDGFYRIDTQASSVEWSGSKITGKTHTGNVSLLNGGLQLTDGVISNGKFAIDMNTITCTDIEDPKWNKKLVGHLKNEDFFAVDKFGTASIVIKSADAEGNVTADLTIKGITNEFTFPATVTTENGSLTATATIEVDRSKFDVRYGSDSFFDDLGDKAINNIIKFNVSIKGQTK